MTIKGEDFEIFDQAYMMYAEGCQYDKPTEVDVSLAVSHAYYYAYNIEIFFDDLQKFWRWTCDIKRTN